MTRLLGAIVAVLIALVFIPAVPADAFEPSVSFQKGTWIGSLEGGGGSQNNLEHHGRQSDIELWYAGARLGYLPFEPIGRGIFLGAFEPGLEALYQGYTHPSGKYWAGLALSGRYHVLALGRFVPYVELLAGAGGTNLKVIEIDSHFAFWLAGGVGASVFLADQLALYAGYRLEHVSNGNTSRPNRGFEANTGVAGISFFFK